MSNEKKSPTPRTVALVAATVGLVYLLIGLGTASHYGITWDQSMQDWYLAERNLRYLLSFDKQWLDFNHPVDLSMGSAHPDLNHVAVPWKTMHFGNLLSAAGCYIFFAKLGLFDSVTAHHAPNFLLMGVVLVLMFNLIKKHFGVAAALVCVFVIVFQPRFWAHGHFNTKDFPYACIMAFTMLAARNGLLKREAVWIFIASILLGLAGSTKPNAVLIPVILAIWYPLSRSGTAEPTDENRISGGGKLFAVALLLSPFIAAVTYIVSWPFLWFDPIGGLRLFLGHYLPWSVRGEGGNQLVTLATFIIVQPPAVLLFGLAGSTMALRGVIKNKKREIYSFLLLWLSLPVLRMLLPGTYNYDAVRHFIEYAVPLGGLTAVGAIDTVKWLARKFSETPLPKRLPAHAMAGLIVAIPFVTWSIHMVKIHPHELVYFNFILGGPSGVEKLCGNCGMATDYWGSSYRQGIDWLNENTEPESIIVVPVAGHIVKSTRDLWMRPDLRLAVTRHKSDAVLESLLVKAKPAEVYVMYITRKSAYGELVRRVDELNEPVYSIMVDGVPILKIVKLDGTAIWPR